MNSSKLSSSKQKTSIHNLVNSKIKSQNIFLKVSNKSKFKSDIKLIPIDIKSEETSPSNFLFGCLNNMLLYSSPNSNSNKKSLMSNIITKVQKEIYNNCKIVGKSINSNKKQNYGMTSGASENQFLKMIKNDKEKASN